MTASLPAYDCELVGHVESYWRQNDFLGITFCCTNKEVFELRFPPALKRIPQNTLARVWVKRVPGKEGEKKHEQVCLHWELL